MRLKTIGDIGLSVRRIRKAKRMTQRQLAQRVGTHQEWISNLETGRIENPGLGTILRAFQVLGVQLIAEADRGSASNGAFSETGCQLDEAVTRNATGFLQEMPPADQVKE